MDDWIVPSHDGKTYLWMPHDEHDRFGDSVDEVIDMVEYGRCSSALLLFQEREMQLIHQCNVDIATYFHVAYSYIEEVDLRYAPPLTVDETREVVGYVPVMLITRSGCPEGQQRVQATAVRAYFLDMIHRRNDQARHRRSYRPIIALTGFPILKELEHLVQQAGLVSNDCTTELDCSNFVGHMVHQGRYDIGIVQHEQLEYLTQLVPRLQLHASMALRREGPFVLHEQVQSFYLVAHPDCRRGSALQYCRQEIELREGFVFPHGTLLEQDSLMPHLLW